MANFNLDDYVPVHDRLQEFWTDNPTGRITTELLFLSEDFKNVVIKANIYRHGAGADEPAATGIASEVNGEGYINKTSFIENAETSAVGRALANLGIQVKKGIASREEMQKVQRMQNEPPTQQAQAPVVTQTGAVAQQPAAPVSPSGPAASEAQVRMLHAMANGGGFNLELMCLERYKCEPEQLTKQQAMAFIDELKAMSTAGGQQQAQAAAVGAGASQAQLAAVAKIAAATGVALTTMIEQEFEGITDPAQLTKKQASHLIETYGTKR